MFLNTFLKNYYKSPELLEAASGHLLARPKVSGRLRPHQKLLAVEPRVMFDGAAIATAELSFHDGALAAAVLDGRTFEANRTQDISSRDVKNVETETPSRSSAPRTLLVIDTGVADWEALVATVPQDVSVLVLDPARNGITQIAERAEALGQISSLQVLSHGDPASMTLGATQVDVAELVRSQADLQRIGEAMTQNGDILLYGCDVALGSAGGAFIGLLAKYTQADVAASTDLTGATRLGGNWTLEASTGSIETAMVVSLAARDGYSHVLSPGAEPILSIQKGVVRDDVAGASTRTFLIDDTSTVSSESSVISAAGVAGNPLTGVINTGVVQTLNLDESGVDGGDKVRYAVVVSNTVNGAFNAFDVKLSDALPNGVVIADISNFRITRGDGQVIYDGTAGTQGNLLRGDNSASLPDLTATLSAFFNGAQGLEFVDPSGTTGILQGAADIGGAPNNSGTNVLVVTYDVTLNSSSATVTQAGTSLTSSATLFSYSDADSGGAGNLIAGASLGEEATINIARASIAKVVVGTSQTHTTGTDVAIGEEVTYQVTITIPEGAHTGVGFHDCLDDNQAVGAAPADYLAGMSHLGIDSIVFSSGLTSSKGGDLASLQASGAITLGPVNGFADRGLSIDFDQLTNANNSNSSAETITITYRTLVLDTPRNQEGMLLLNFAEVKVGGTQQNIATDGVRVREPDWSIVVTPDGASHLPGDVVNFTVCVAGGNITGFTGSLDAMLPGLPAGLTYVPGSFVVDVSSTGVGVVANASDMSATITSLSSTQKAVFTFQATVSGSASLGQSFTLPGLIRYSSLPNSPDNTGTLSPTLTETTLGGLQQDSERTGAQGVGGALNDYARTDTGSVVVAGAAVTLTIVQTSEPGTVADAGNSANPGLAENIPVAVGEVVRYRALVRLPETTTLDAAIRVALPDGLRFLNDGAIAYAFVSDGGLSSSTLAGGVSDGGTPSNPQDIASIRPGTVLPGVAISRVGGGTVFASGDDVLFSLGNLSNADADADGEWVVVEFNAVVEDQLSNQDALSNHRGASGAGSASLLSTQFDFVKNASTALAVVGTSDLDSVNVQEPSIVNLSKTVLITTGNTASFEVTFSNTGHEEAYNVRLLDDYLSATNITAGSLSVTSITSAAAVANNSSANALDLSIASLAPGQTVTVRYNVTITDLSQAVPPRQAEVTYQGLSNAGRTLTPSQSGVPIAGLPVSAPGTLREGLSFVADASATDNYIDRVSAGSGVIAGRLWDDTNVPGSANSANNVYEPGAGGDKPLAGISVTLQWIGPGPAPIGFPVVLTTDADGKYCFAGLPAGNYKVIIPSGTITTASDGIVKQRYEADASVDQMIMVTLPEGAKIDGKDFVFVQINEAPTVNLPSTSVSFNEDQVLCFDGGSGTVGNVVHLGLISVGDPDAQDPTYQTVTLSATQGILDIGTMGQANNGALSNVSVSGDQSATLTLTGSRADINALMATLCYKPNANYSGTAQISVRVDDRGNGGDLLAGNGIPFEPVADNLSATRVIALSLAPLNDPPVAPIEIFTVAREVTLTSPGAKLSAVQGPSDPDLPSDTLQIQVLSLPSNAQGVFYRATPSGPTPVVIGDLLTPAQLQQLCFVPSTSLTGTPDSSGKVPAGTLGYKVTDVTGASANGSISILVPFNLPPVAPDQIFIVNQGATVNTPQATLNNLTDVRNQVFGVVLPSDPDQPANTLALTVNSLPDAASQGTFFRPVAGGAPVPLKVGDVIDTAQLQQLQFVPAPSLGAGANPVLNAQGLLNAGTLTYTANDGRGGSALGSIAINVRPTTANSPPPNPVPPLLFTPPVVPPPIVTPPTLQPTTSNVQRGQFERLADEVRTVQAQDLSHFDPFNALAVKSSVVNEIRIAKADLGKATAERPQKEEDDCQPAKPQVKIKPKAVKRALVEEKLAPRIKNFSELLNAEKKRFKPPVKIKSKPATETIC